MRKKLCAIFLFGICAIVLCLNYISNYDVQNKVRSRFHNYHNTLDTYHRRILKYLNERKISLFSYEQLNVTNGDLERDINAKVIEMRDRQHQELLEIKNDQELQRGCQQTCCWSRRKMKRFYNGEKDRFPTVLDRLSQIDIKLLADLHYGNLPVPDEIQLSKLTYDILPCLQNSTIIFVDTPDLSHFFQEIHKRISVNYVLITGDSDLSCPIHIINSHLHLLNQIFARKTRIIHWFAMNCDLGNNDQWKQSKVFTCIPQGISQWSNQRYFMQLASGKDDSIHNIDLKTNDYWVLTSFAVLHAPKYRKPLSVLSCMGRLKNISKCFYQKDTMNLWKYYTSIGRSKFVFSPPGVGMDCYRTWEALYLGSIPIVVNSSLNPIFEKLPVLIVDNYDEINLDFLKNMYDNMTKQTYDYRRLYKGYWQREINSYRNTSDMIQIHYMRS